MRLIVGGLFQPSEAGRFSDDITISLELQSDVLGDVRTLPFDSGIFQEVCFEFLPLGLFTGPYLPAENNCSSLMESWRVLKDGGILTIYTGDPPGEVDQIRFNRIGFSKIQYVMEKDFCVWSCRKETHHS